MLQKQKPWLNWACLEYENCKLMRLLKKWKVLSISKILSPYVKTFPFNGISFRVKQETSGRRLDLKPTSKRALMGVFKSTRNKWGIIKQI